MELDKLDIPQFGELPHAAVIKPAILHAQRSAALGFWLVATPVFFIACVIMKYFFMWKFGIIQNFESFWTALDRDKFGVWLQPLVLVAAPAAALVMNILAILHIQYDKARKELNINVKIRWQNLLLAAVSLAVLGILLLYAVGGFFHHQATGAN